MNPPLEYESISNLKRMEMVAFVILPAGHGCLTHLRQHVNSFSNYNQKWRSLAMSNATRQGAKGIYHLQFMVLCFSKYWCNQRRSSARVALNDPEELIDFINIGQQWEPTTPHSLAASLKLSVLGCFSRTQV